MRGRRGRERALIRRVWCEREGEVGQSLRSLADTTLVRFTIYYASCRQFLKEITGSQLFKILELQPAPYPSASGQSEFIRTKGLLQSQSICSHGHLTPYNEQEISETLHDPKFARPRPPWGEDIAQGFHCAEAVCFFYKCGCLIPWSA